MLALQGTHFKYLNAYCRAAEELHYPPQHPLSAYQFHRDLFASGMDRIIMVRTLDCDSPVIIH